MKIMRKTIYIVLAALGLCLFAGCGSSDKEKVSPLAILSKAASVPSFSTSDAAVTTWYGVNPILSAEGRRPVAS